eukprot:2433628-Rhodomonas_salina.1
MPVELYLGDRARSVNCCACCGLPFLSVGSKSKWSDLLAEFDDEFVAAYPEAQTCFYDMQDSHLLHKMQR